MAEALVIVDYQNDFAAPGGALAVPGGEDVAARIDALAHDPRFALVVATRDWHPPDHRSFAARGGPWPAHCVQGTPGAELHPALDRTAIDAVVDKGQDPDAEGYSAFEPGELRDLLREHGVDAITVVGLATDYCVLDTARDALREGLAVTVDASAVRAVDVAPGDGERALATLRDLGARVEDLSAGPA
jgi:nicotinamidase-related amidase